MGKKKKEIIVKLRWDEQDMVTQRILITRGPENKVVDDFYVCRFYGSRDCWIEIKVLSKSMQEYVLKHPGRLRDLETGEGRDTQIVSVNWLLELAKPGDRSRQWLEQISNVFDQDNSKGQLVGKTLFRT